MPGETTITIFRRRLERHGLAHQLFKEIKGHLDERGFSLKEGTIVDAFGLASAQRGEAGPGGASVPNRGKSADAARKSNSHSQTNQRLLNQDVWEWQETLVEQY